MRKILKLVYFVTQREREEDRESKETEWNILVSGLDQARMLMTEAEDWSSLSSLCSII